MFKRHGLMVLTTLVFLAGCGRPEAISRPAAERPSATAAPSLATPAARVIPEQGYPAPDQALAQGYPAPARLPAAATTPTLPVVYESPEEISIGPEPAVAEPEQTPVPSGPLLREVWTLPAGEPPVTHLMIRGPVSTRTDGPDTLWRVDLNTLEMQQLATFTGEYTTPATRLAPLGGLVATTSNSTTRYAVNLFVWQPNDTIQQFNILVSGEFRFGCGKSFLWQPQSQNLIYQNSDPTRLGVRQVYRYDASHQTPAQLILEQPEPIDLLGWSTPDHLVFGISHLTNEPTRSFPAPHLSIEELDTRTGVLQTLARIPYVGEPPFHVSCPRLSPDGQRLLFIQYGQYHVLDFATQQRFVVAPMQNTVLWAPDSQTVLIDGVKPVRQVELFDARTGASRAKLSLAPALPASNDFQIRAASPDGRFLVGCAGSGEYFRDLVDTSAWLYNVQEDRWSLLAKGYYWCPEVAGWEVQP